MHRSTVIALGIVGLLTLILGGTVYLTRETEPSEPEEKDDASSRDGLGAGYWLIKAIDATVGLPEYERPYEPHEVRAREFMDAIEAGQTDTAWPMLAPEYRAGVDRKALLNGWVGAVEKLGAADALAAERRWSTMRHSASDDGPHVYTFHYSRNHANGSTISKVGVVQRGEDVMVCSFEVKRRYFRMRDR